MTDMVVTGIGRVSETCVYSLRGRGRRVVGVLDTSSWLTAFHSKPNIETSIATKLQI